VAVIIARRVALFLKIVLFELMKALNKRILSIAYSIMCNIKVSGTISSISGGIVGRDEK
jgi:hypothetical protein